MIDKLIYHNILMILSLVTFLFYLVALFFLFRIREKLKNFSVSFIFITFGIIALMIFAVLDLLVRLQLMERIDFLQGSLMTFFALCFLVAVIRTERVVGKVFYNAHRSGHKKN